MTLGNTDPALPEPFRLLPELASGPSPADLQAMHEAALRILDEVGLAVDNKEIIGLLTLHDGARVERGRLHLAPWLVEEHATAYRRQARSDGKAPGRRAPWDIRLTISGGPHFWVDPDTDQVRPITLDDLILGTRLVDALDEEGVRGRIPAVVLDVPAPLMALLEYKVACEHSRHGRGFVNPCPIAGLEFLYAMHQVMGHDFHLPLYVVSPLRLVGESLEAVLHFRRRANVSHSSSSMPIMGVDAPIHLRGAFVQSIAEALGGYVVLKLIDPDAPATFSVMAFAFDMRYANMVYGSPEQNLCDLMGLWVNAFYGHRIGTRSLRTMAKRPGLQAAAEKAASAAFGALAGSRSFSGAGILALDQVFSPEQLMLDVEIRNYASRLVRGIRFDQEALALDVIAAAAPGGEYLLHESTLSHFRDEFWTPDLFERRTVKAWQTHQERDVRELARTRVREKLAVSSFELDADKRRVLDEIYRRASERLVG
ncbi:MAG: trimethylamine methyltransferase family protein [Chloroflexi bacterium]|nr:trimethylamine methyltransferase family protein [Chloroflexota bacterium]